MYTSMSTNSVSDSLERCRQAFSIIVEGQTPIEEEEDYLEKASKFVEEEPMDDDDAMFIDADKPEDELLSKISNAVSDTVDAYAQNGTVIETVDKFETDDGGIHNYCFEFESDCDVNTMTAFASDIEKNIGDGFEIRHMVEDEVGGVCKMLMVVVARSCEQVTESTGYTPFKQVRKRQRKPMQIKKSAQFIRNNRLMKRLFRRKYFAKRKLLFGNK